MIESESISLPDSLFGSFRKGRVVFFVGPDFITDAGGPSLKEIKDALIKKFSCPENYASSPFYVITQYCVFQSSRKEVLDSLRQFYTPYFEIQSKGYRILAELTRHSENIILAGWEENLERTLMPEAIVLSRNDRIENSSLSGKSRIFKLHGHLNDDESVILTRSELLLAYQSSEHEESINGILKKIFEKNSVVFLGFNSFNEIFLDILENLEQYVDNNLSQRHYFISVGLDTIEQNILASKNIFTLPVNTTVFLRLLYLNTCGFFDRVREMDHMLSYQARSSFLLYGPAGIGKSRLLHRFYSKCQDNSEILGYDELLYYDFAQNETESDLQVCLNFLLDFAQRNSYMEQLKGLELYSWSNLNKTLLILAELVRGKNLLLALDHIDSLNKHLRAINWFIENFLLNTLMKNCAFVRLVATSRYPISWDKELRQHSLYKLLINPFEDAEDLRAVVDYYTLLDLDTPLSSQICDFIVLQLQSLTRGHPGCITYVMKNLLAFLQQNDDIVVDIEQQARVFFDSGNIKTLVSNIAQIVDPDREYREHHEVVCVLRQVNVGVLNHLCERINEPIENAMEWLRGLQRIRLVKRSNMWSTSYEVDEVLGYLITNQMLYEKPEYFRKLQIAAYQTFQRLSGEYSQEWRATALHEMIYHFLLSKIGAADAKQALFRELLDVIRQYFSAIDVKPDIPGQSLSDSKTYIIDSLQEKLRKDITLRLYVNRLFDGVDQEYETFLNDISKISFS